MTKRRMGFAWHSLLLVALIGCGSVPDAPDEQVQYYFQRGEFEQALEVIASELPAATDAQRRAQLLLMQGRCYWEMSARTQESERRQDLLVTARQALSESIEAKDSADARHIRANIYELLGQQQLAQTDQLRWRELDKSYGSAYINERNDPVLDELPPVEAAATGEGEKSQKDTTTSLAELPPVQDNGENWDGRGQWDSDPGQGPVTGRFPGSESSRGSGPDRAVSGGIAGTEHVPSLAGAGETAQPSTVSKPSTAASPSTIASGGQSQAAATGSTRPSPSRPAASSASRSQGAAERRLMPPGGMVAREGGAAAPESEIDEPPSTSGNNDAGSASTDADENGEVREDGETETASPRRSPLPGSTWQPLPQGFAGPGGGAVPWRSSPAPTTGLTGPVGGGVPGYGTGTPSTLTPTMPTTGIVGPSAVSPGMGFAGPSLPTTGIGTGSIGGSPSASSLPAGMGEAAGDATALPRTSPTPGGYGAGIPPEFMPPSLGARRPPFAGNGGLPYTGALPPTALPGSSLSARPGSPASGAAPSGTAASALPGPFPGPNFSGPNYNPLRPSPLTQPTGLSGLPSLSPSSRSGVTTSPLRQPSPASPRPLPTTPRVP